MEKARPEKSLHVCVGFYHNGHYVVNYVRHEDLNRNVAYNRTFRPGRAYFVDGEWACGGRRARRTADELHQGLLRAHQDAGRPGARHGQPSLLLTRAAPCLKKKEEEP